MNRRLTIKQAAAESGLSEYTIRKGIREHRYPHIRTGLGSGKILIDPDLLDKYLEQEAVDSVIPVPSRRVDIYDYGKLRRVAE